MLKVVKPFWIIDKPFQTFINYSSVKSMKSGSRKLFGFGGNCEFSEKPFYRKNLGNDSFMVIFGN